MFFQGSRQMDNFSRRYYEKELGAGIGPAPSMKEHFGYTEPFRRFVQREGFEPQANEISNTMPSWMPGDDYLTNFRVGDPYIDQGSPSCPTQKPSRTRARPKPLHDQHHASCYESGSRARHRAYGVKLRVFAYGLPAPGQAFLPM